MATIIGANIPNLPWQDKPVGYPYPVWRFDGNPIITRDNLHFANSIFNSAVVPFGDGFAGVFRVDDPRAIRTSSPASAPMRSTGRWTTP